MYNPQSRVHYVQKVILDDHGRPQGGWKTGIWSSWQLGLRSKNSGKRESAVWFWLVGVILAMTICLPIWHSHCTLHKSHVHCSGNMQLWACNSLNPLLCLQRQVAKLGSELLYYWPLLRNNNNNDNKSWKMHFKSWW